MTFFKKIVIYFTILILSAYAFGADVILNEYNAVAGSTFLNSGDSSADLDGSGHQIHISAELLVMAATGSNWSLLQTISICVTGSWTFMKMACLMRR
jgi:hypothetical protein